jgi:multicomponent Na+:H+ antiporter subunit A
VPLTFLVLSTFVAVPLAMWAARHGRSWVAAAYPALLFAVFAQMLPNVAAGQEVRESLVWIEALGVDLAFRVDGLALLLALLITGIGSFIFLYASRYLADHPDQPKFFAFLTLFMGAMLGAVLADDLIALLVFWELTSFASFLLIGYEPEKAASRRSAHQGLLITVAGGTGIAGRCHRPGYCRRARSGSVNSRPEHPNWLRIPMPRPSSY